MRKRVLRNLLILSLTIILIAATGIVMTVSADTEHSHNDITFTEWTSTNSLPSSAGNYYLASDVTISSTWSVPSGTVNLCLCDHKIAYSGSSGSVIRINSGATLKLYDCGTTEHYYYIGATSTYNSSCLGAIVASESDSNYVNAERRGSFVGGYITGGYGTGYSGSTVFGGGVFVDGGTFVMNGGCIFGNRLSVRDGGNGGGGVAVRKTSSSFIMNGGYIIGNHAGRFGGGIRIDGGSFTMNGGEIRHNTANTPGSGGAGCGGGLHMGGLDGGATVTITGGIIEGNYAGLKDGRGGGINVAGGTLTMTGGTVSGNNATLSGGGINGAFTLSGKVIVTDNTVGGTFVADSYKLNGGTTNNVYLPNNQKITLANAVDNGSDISITLESTTGAFTSGWNTAMGNADPAKYFTSDNANYGVLLKDGEAQIGVKPHEHDGVNFEKWTSTNSLPSSAGNYHLAADVTISGTWNAPSGVNLCLCGHGIKKTGTGTVIKVGEGVTLKLYDCDTTTEHRYSVASPAANGAGVATVNDSLTSGYQTFTGGYITGGYITGGYQYGAGINLEGSGATLYMYGGTIIGNRLTAGSTGGGGVCVQDWDKSGGFYMYGGSIIGNTSNYGGGVYVRSGKMELIGGNISKNVANGNIGGGVLVFGGNSTLIVKGGSISDNKAVHGGAVEASGDGTVTISGGSFTNNIATGKGGALTNQRTDGDTSPATFNISGTPVFSGNTANGQASEVYLCNTAVLNLTAELTNTTKIGITKASTTGTITSGWSTYMTDGEGKVADPADYFVSENSDYVVFLRDGEAQIGVPHEHDGLSFTKWTSTNSLPTSGNYYLDNDVTVSSTTTVSGTLNLCLNGHSITYIGATGTIFKVSGNGKALNIYDCDETIHYYYIDSATNLGVVVASAEAAAAGNAERNGTFTGGYITGGKGYPVNPAVGGGLYIESGGVATLKGGTFIGNTTAFGGAIQVRYKSSFTMTGGAIIGNKGAGGAINADGNSSNKSSVSILGGTITDNTSGIRIGSSGSSLLALSSNVEIFNNDDYDLYLSETRTIRIDGALNNTHKIVLKFTDANVPRSFTSGWSTYMGSADPADYFVPEVSGYYIELVSGEAKVMPHSHSWSYSASENVITATCVSEKGACSLEAQTLTITAAGKTYDGTAFTATVAKSADWTTENGLAEPGDITYSGNTNAGTYTASVTAGEKTASVEFTITPASVTVTAEAKSKTYGDDDPAFTYIVDGLIGTDALSGELSRETGENVGDYAITQGTLANDNYTITYTGANLTINPAPMTVTSDGYTGDYDGAAHGISVTVTVPDGATVKYGTEEGVYTLDACPTYVNAGTYTVYYEVTKANYITATGSDTVTINQINAAVMITGHNSTVDYDGTEHTITGYDAVADTELYDVTKDFAFISEAIASQTNAGTTEMGLVAEMFENTNPNFATVTFEIVDGYQTVEPINATVTITGHNSTVDYDGTEHTVTGYDAVADTILYDVTKDFVFISEAIASQTNAGTIEMGLCAEMFENTNPNFATVTFEIVDGYQTVEPINATVTITGHNSAVTFDGAGHTTNGYDAVADTELYDVAKDFTFSGNANAKQINAGTANMGLTAEMFENNNPNFATVTFEIVDGYITVEPINAIVRITGYNSTVDYDGIEHTVTGFDAVADTELYDVTKDFTFSGNAAASQTNSGTTEMGLVAEMFENTNPNFATVTFEIVDGYQTVDPINATVTITGHNSTVDYDGTEHTVTGYDAVADNELYDVTKDFTFSGNATAKQINAGTANMGLAVEMFENTNPNFATVTFEIVDGYQTVNPISVTVTITGHNNTADYDGEEHTVNGFDAVADNNFYDVTKDFTFSGNATATQTNVGTAYMGLATDQFANTNANFATVTFEIVDGYMTVLTVDVTIIAPTSADPVYDGSEHDLIISGEIIGGTIYYALGTSTSEAPDDEAYKTSVPFAKEVGNYYVWYKVEGDENHNDVSPKCLKVTLAEGDWGTLRGVLYQNDGATALGGAKVTLMAGNKVIDTVVADVDGRYWFSVPAGVYNIVAEYGDKAVTILVDLSETNEKDLLMPDGKTESHVKVNSDDGEEAFGVVVGGLDEEAHSIRESDGVSEDSTVSVVMTVDKKDESISSGAESIKEAAKNQQLDFFEIKVEKTVDSVTTLLDTTSNVLEIVVPYANAGKKGVTVYSYHDSEVKTFTMSDSKESGTFRVDEANSLVYIYTNSFSTYAIGYTPYYKVSGDISLGSFGGTATITLTNQDDGSVFTLDSAAFGTVGFKDIPSGKYQMTIAWEDGAKNALSMTFTVGETVSVVDEVKNAATDADSGAKDDVAALTNDEISPLDMAVNLSNFEVIEKCDDPRKFFGSETSDAMLTTKKERKPRETAVEPRRRDVFMI